MPSKEFRGVTQRSFQSNNKISTKFQGVIPQLSQQKTKTEKDYLKNKTELADLEIFQSFKMTEDAKINGSQARSFPGH